MQIPLDMAVDLDQALGRDAADDLQSFGEACGGAMEIKLALVPPGPDPSGEDDEA